MTTSLSRRDFLRAGAVAGAGLTIAIHLPGCAPGETAPAGPPFVPNAWVRISPDGSVTLLVDRSEMGQGVYTALPMLLAEELDVPWAAVKVEQAGAAKEYYQSAFPAQATGGSLSVANAWMPLREAGARARVMLVSAAAANWSVDPAECRTENGFVIHTASKRRAKYGELVAQAAALPVPEKVELKDRSAWKLIGTDAPRLDVQQKVMGRAGFGVDVDVPNMLVGVVARCPVFGGAPDKWDEAAAKQVAGVRHVVAISSGIAVIADGYWAAKKGRDALNISWKQAQGRNGAKAQQGLGMEEIRRDMERLSTRRAEHTPKTVGSGGLGSGTRIGAVYGAPYLAHACMEPMNATAHVEATQCTVWAPTQYQCGPAIGGGVQEVAARITGLDPSKVTVHTTFLGGGFGRRAMQDFVIDAVEASKAAGVPVKMMFSREDDIQHDYYRPPTHVTLAASLGFDGKPTGLTMKVLSPSILASSFGAPKTALDDQSIDTLANTPYAIPNLKVEVIQPDWAVPLGWWRSVGASQNGFVIESFIDELAAAAKQDPFEYRKAMLADKPRHLGVLTLAAEKAGWGSPLPAGRARGIAVVESFNSYVAEVAEVSLNPDRTIRVHKVVAAVDCGTVVNPEIVRAQVESAVVFGLTAALYGEITVEGGKVVQSNFHDYPLLRMQEMPVVEVHLVPSTEKPTGIGEPGTPPIAPAVGNAVYALTGQRLRSLPMRSVPG